MFGIFKKLFKKSEAPQPAAPASNRTPVEAPRAPSASAQRAAPAKPQVPKLAAPAPGEDIISIPLAALVKRLPEAMQKDVASPPRASDALQLPVNFILLQMPRGEIKISFAELRQASPPEIFVDSSPNDLTDVSLPLDLIVPQLGPKYLNRRSNQKHLAISEDIGPVFNAPSGIPKDKVEIRGLDTESGEAPPAPAAAPAPAAPAAPIPMQAPAARRAEPMIPAKAPEPAPAPEAEAPIRFTPPPMESAKPKPAPASVTPIKPATPAPIKPAALPGTAARPAPLPGTTAPKPAPAAAAAPPPPPPAPAPELPKMRLSQPEPAPAPAPAPAMPAAAAAPSGPTIQAAMWALMIAWPEALRKEIAAKNLTQYVVAFPIDEVEQGIKSGKVCFPWASIQAWIQPAVPPGTIAFETTEPLNIPLQVVAPLFMAARKPAAAQKKVQILESIPDVFAGRPQEPEPGAAPTPAAAPAPEPAPEPAAPAAPAAPLPAALSPTFAGALRPKPQVPTGPLDVAAMFGQPNKRSWTPVELVQCTSRLEGVAGAMIAMADGLQVASELPSHMNGDTLAAFLPQIFARVGHYTNEIKLGDPSSISFTTDQQVWQINKAGNVFLLTVGRPGETLPVAQINAVATQLERQSKTN